MIDFFEKVSLFELSEEERKRILYFVVVGGGLIGVEFVAELYDFVIEDLVIFYFKVKDLVRIIFLEVVDYILIM